ncbi:ATP-dependent DNA ligase [Chryseobacterium sp. MDT2-18]|uniref:ATP-dependent DNA ligase n=1 Tax=Chryseobacterium sp. MDT2-18 TaxID=1259136 RepID=UPI00277FBB1A|nr:ATP-dependent DNA ligase [Chryseobacterium sp. MDT2-18]MDQ0476904.1 DNA ligase-1 [Chryseobacterium sp. MDT2-18]
MKDFAQLINALDSTNKTTAKVEAMVSYLNTADANDKLWFLALFTGKRPKRPVNTNLLKQWALEITLLPEWLFIESYAAVGDLGETLSLILPNSENQIDKPLTQWMTELTALKDQTDDEKKKYVLESWNGLNHVERFIFNKLIGGSFRIGVSKKLLINALSKYSGIETNILMHSIMGKWKIEDKNFDDLILGTHINPDASKPYPFCLAYPLEKEIQELGDRKNWQAEFKWDGIRGQFIKRNEEIFIWSRGEELVTEQFPEIVSALKEVEGNFVIDGEILVVKNDRVLNFNELQKRLNRKTIPKKMLEELPCHIFVYDILELEFEDLRERSLSERRLLLESLLVDAPLKNIKISEIITTGTWEELAQIRENSRDNNSEGLMLKETNSRYHAGRKKGDWWKWKVSPLTIDAVLIYAQKGSGRRSSYYTDYTFAVKNDDKLVTIAKAYSGLTDKEIMEVSKFVNKNAIEKFGPVRTVKPELVFEIAFEGIGFSSRHKSGVALRFPRIVRWRRDKTADQIDDLEEIKKLIT